ncbi:MAG: NAD-dependent epimerase/dehydratase family protein [Clostridia bacterium]|nr:NAD-dependent epimerase/dehydratase family protein [Clostridia bacterium]
MNTIKELDDFMSNPSKRLIEDIKKIDGDIMVLGAGGKMGPTLCKLTANAIKHADIDKKVYAVSRFSDQSHVDDLMSYGIIVIKADLLENDQLEALPDIKNIIYMAGRKFGTSDDQSLTWAMNAYLPGRVADKFRKSRIVVFSTGNVYPFVKVKSNGCLETDPVGPVGIYAQSCLGRENVFRYFSNKYKTPMLFYRLNYAIDLRYGVLLEVAKAVYNNQPLDITSSHANIIWQGDANESAIRCLLHCSYPPEILNVTGKEMIRLKTVAEKFGKLFDKAPVFIGEESDECLLSNASKSIEWFGENLVTVDDMIAMIADWVKKGGQTIDKPTHFQERKGNF